LRRQDYARRASASNQSRIQDWLESLPHIKRRGNASTHDQQSVQFFQAILQADPHLLKSAPQLSDLILALYLQWTVQLALCDPVSLAG
jgi:hypothetical protein